MDTSSALSFTVAAPFIATAISFITNLIPVTVPAKWNPLISLTLTFGWGGVLWQSGRWDGDLAVFIVTGLTVAYAVIGLRSQAAQFGIPISKLSGQEPPIAR